MRHIMYLLVVFNVLYLGLNLSRGGVAGEQPVASVPDGARTLVLLEESRKGDLPDRGASKADDRFTENVSAAEDGARKVSDVNSGQVRDKAGDDLLDGSNSHPSDRPVPARQSVLSTSLPRQ